MTTKFWLETESGVRELLPVQVEEQVYEKAREIYPDDGEDEHPTCWVVMRDPEDEEDYFLVPGGPACEEFTWMPRSMWQEGGPLAALDKE